MGIIKKQTILGTIYTYIGAGLGVLTNLILLAWFFTPEQIGLLNLLVAYSLLFAQFANLGFDNVTIRLFPFFRDEKTIHHGFFALMIKVLFLGSLISISFYLLFFFYLPKNTSDKLFIEFGLYVVPLIFFTLLFNSFDTYSRSLYKSIRGTFLKEVLQRLIIILAIILYIFLKFDFSIFVFLYVLALCIPSIILYLLLYFEGNVSFISDSQYLSLGLKKEIINVSLFGMITIFSSTIVSNIDKIMIQHYIDVYSTGLYSIAYFFGVIISMPSRALTKISSAVIAEAWKNNDTDTIFEIYYKSCLNQMLFSLLLFVGIWANIDNILLLLPEKYVHIKWVVFWIALGSFIDMSTGINNTIIATSPKYKLQSLFMAIFVLIIVVSNIIFIPLYKINGAAFASALSLFVFNFIRWIYLWKQYKMQPFNFKFIIVLAIGLISFLLGILIPKLNPFYFDIIVRSLLIAIIYTVLIIILKPSADIDERIKTYYLFIKKIFEKMKSVI